MDFSCLQTRIEKIKKAGFKVGLLPWFQHPPEWVSDYVRLRCVEHGKESTLISLWDERLLDVYDRLYKALYDECGGDIDYLYLLSYGDFGELFYQQGVDHYVFSPSHGHGGLWCGDNLARADFKAFLIKKYGTTDQMNMAWHSGFSSFDEDFMPGAISGVFQRRYDFAWWYCKSLIDYSDKVYAIIRKYFPNIEAGFPVGGGTEPLSFGQIKNFSVKLAKKYDATARWTGWALYNDFKLSNICSRRIASAAKYYGVPFGVEAALYLDGKYAVDAIYEAVANSTSLIHNDAGNIIRAGAAYKRLENYTKPLPFFCDKAIFYPVEAELCGLINIEEYYKILGYIRCCTDYEIFDSYMAADGFLDSVSAVILPDNCPIRAETAELFKSRTVYYKKSAPPYLLETGEAFKYGTALDDFSELGTPDGCFYTDHGDTISRYDPNDESIVFLDKKKEKVYEI